jgi:hypothetical protein
VLVVVVEGTVDVLEADDDADVMEVVLGGIAGAMEVTGVETKTASEA